MKILFCNYEYPPLGGGGGTVMAALAKELARRHEVSVLTSSALGLPAESIEDNIRILRVPVVMRRELAVATMTSMASYLPTATWRGLRLPRGSFDVINTHFAVPTGPLGHVLARWHKVPNVLSVHGGDLYDPSKRMSPHRHAWLRGTVRYLLKQAAVVVGQSQNTVRHVDSIYGVKRPVELIPLGIERPPTAPARDRAHFGLPEDALVLITIGRLVPRKSTVQLVTVLARSKLHNAHLLIVGSGPEEQAVAAEAAAAGLTDRVHLLGRLTNEDKYRALAAADIFVSTSQHEGFGLVFLEAMAFGLPVVCYDEGGQVDFLKSGETGFVIKLNALDEFSRALTELAQAPQLRARCGDENKRRVQDYFIERCAERYEAVFANAIEAAGRSGVRARTAGQQR